MNGFKLSCPIPIKDYPRVVLAHGGGGKLMHQLIEKMFVLSFGNSFLDQRHDATVLDVKGSRIAMTTDSYVVHPLFFPGGNIGSMAVHGTVNDLSMAGATPKYLSVAFIIEEGLAMEDLWRIVQSMKQAADASGVFIVTGDTKVVDKGKGDGIFINTTGVGVLEHKQVIAPQSIQKGDKIIVSGDLGRHGIAIMAKRQGLEFETTIESDSASVVSAVQKLLSNNIDVHCLRDLTRGGLASALNELADHANASLHIDENFLPVDEEVRGACEILGFDPIYVANEGRFIAFVPEKDADKTLKLLQQEAVSEKATLIGEVVDVGKKSVTMKSLIGVNRIVDMISGEQLPRIC